MGFGLQQVGVQLQAVVEAVAGAQRRGQVAIAIGITFVAAGVRRLDVDAVGVRATDAQAVPATTVTTGNAGAARVGVMGAVAGREERLDALPLALAGEDLDHPADGLRSVQAGARTADHLDALDQLQRQILQGRAAARDRSDLDAVDHHQHVIGFGAAHEQRGGLAGPAVVGQRYARHLLEQLGQRTRLAAFDPLAVDHGHRGQALLSRLRGAGGGHHLLLEIQRGCGQLANGKGKTAEQHIGRWLETGLASQGTGLRRAHPHD